MKSKRNYMVFFYNDRGPESKEYMTKQELKDINCAPEYVTIYKITEALTMEEKIKLGIGSKD